MKRMSFGKYRAVQRCSTPHGLFSIVAVDHQDALRQVLRPDNPAVVTAEDMTRFKLDVTVALISEVSAILLDPVYGAFQAVCAGVLKQAGLLVELERADYQMEPLPLNVEIDPDWNVGKIKQMGADGVKLFFYYNPHNTDHATRQAKVIRQIVVGCDEHEIPLYAEPIVYGVSDTADKQTLVIESAHQISKLGVDVLKLEFPVDVNQETDEARWVEACEAITQAVSVPWVLLSAGVAFDVFARQLEIACKAGASGFIVGRGLWGDAAGLLQPERIKWLDTIGNQRLRLLNSIIQQHGRPWHKAYDGLILAPVTIDTFRQYPKVNFND